MMAKPMKTLELHIYPMTQFLIIAFIPCHSNYNIYMYCNSYTGVIFLITLQLVTERKVTYIYNTIALFTVSFSHLHYNVIQHGCEAILD